MTTTAISITAKESAELVEAQLSDQPQPDQLIGRTRYTLMSPGTELAHNYCGDTFPNWPGYSAVFEVTAVGTEVADQWQVGDLAFCTGNHRSHQQVRAQDAVPVPEGLSPALAPLARLMGVSMTTLMTTQARPGERVIVTGAGPVGLLAALMMRHAGYELLVVEPDSARRDCLRDRGVEVRKRVPLDDPAWAGKVALVIECSGHEAAVLDGCQVVRRLGEVVLVGVPWRQRTELSAHAILHAVFHKYVVLRSGWEWELPREPSIFHAHSIRDNFATALRWLRDGHIDVEGLCEQVDPRHCQQAYQRHLKKEPGALFTLFRWQASGHG